MFQLPDPKLLPCLIMSSKWLYMFTHITFYGKWAHKLFEGNQVRCWRLPFFFFFINPGNEALGGNSLQHH